MDKPKRGGGPGRPRGIPQKPPEDIWPGYAIKLPRELLEEFKREVPAGRAEWIRQAIRERLARQRRRGAE